MYSNIHGANISFDWVRTLCKNLISTIFSSSGAGFEILWARKFFDLTIRGLLTSFFNANRDFVYHVVHFGAKS